MNTEYRDVKEGEYVGGGFEGDKGMFRLVCREGKIVKEFEVPKKRVGVDFALECKDESVEIKREPQDQSSPADDLSKIAQDESCKIKS